MFNKNKSGKFDAKDNNNGIPTTFFLKKRRLEFQQSY